MKFLKRRPVPSTYKPPLEAKEVIELYGQLTLHQQAALVRLISRNIKLSIGTEEYMGYEFDYNVNGALICATPAAETD